MKTKVKILYACLILIGFFTICLPFTPFSPCFKQIVSSIVSGLSILIGTYATWLSDKNANALDKALKIKRGKCGKVENLELDAGVY